MDRRLSRRSPRPRLALLVGVLVLAVPGVSSCGFNYATDRGNNIVNGTNYQDGVVDVLNALIVSSEDGSGTFIATLANNSPDEVISFESLSFGGNSTIQVAAFSPVEVAPHGMVNLSTEEQGIKVAGDLTAGHFISLSVGFDNGETADMDVPVVPAEDEYTDLDNGTGAPSPSAEPSAE
jgi:hypothetical protein